VQLAPPPIVNPAIWARLAWPRTVEVMATSVPHRDGPVRQYHRVPWSPQAWGQALYQTGAIPAQLAAPLVVVALGLAIDPGRVQVNLLPGLVVVFFAVPLLTAIQRHRLRTTAGVVIPAQPVIPHRLSVRGIVAAARSQATWRQLGYHVLAGPALAAAALAAFGVWLAGILCAFVYVYAWTLPVGNLLRRDQSASLARHFTPISHFPIDLFLTVGGIALLAAAPWLTAAVGTLDARAARALLGPSRAEELEHRVERLAETRAGVVDAADAERRRLERDLHDGTQQRLVSLAMRLGMARAGHPDAAQANQIIAEAHEEAKAALLELRQLVRGLHPAVLEDRGLDAALSGVAARLPIPVRLTVDVPRRPSPTVEAVAYFVVSEGLTNIAKHAQASQAEVFVQRASDRLHIIVSDDGVGGADPARGTGLAGLAKRAASVDGTFDIASPPGGPTLLTVDLPCAR
jgi:signal transduction histidine kinase